jgi:hypothetical protein
MTILDGPATVFDAIRADDQLVEHLRRNRTSPPDVAVAAGERRGPVPGDPPRRGCRRSPQRRPEHRGASGGSRDTGPCLRARLRPQCGPGIAPHVPGGPDA